jgi:phycocyanin beta chain
MPLASNHHKQNHDRKSRLKQLQEIDSMFDAFAKVVSQADARGEFLSSGQLDALTDMVAAGNKRLDVVNRLTSNASTIVANAARALFAEQPQLTNPGGNAYTNRRMAACLRDMEIILRYVTYATLAGDASVLDDRCLNGLRETYVALGTPGASVSVGINKMKDAATAIANDSAGITQGDCSSLMSELAGYFDRAAAAVG